MSKQSDFLDYLVLTAEDSYKNDLKSAGYKNMDISELCQKMLNMMEDHINKVVCVRDSDANNFYYALSQAADFYKFCNSILTERKLNALFKMQNLEDYFDTFKDQKTIDFLDKNLDRIDNVYDDYQFGLAEESIDSINARVFYRLMKEYPSMKKGYLNKYFCFHMNNSADEIYSRSFINLCESLEEYSLYLYQLQTIQNTFQLLNVRLQQINLSTLNKQITVHELKAKDYDILYKTIDVLHYEYQYKDNLLLLITHSMLDSSFILGPVVSKATETAPKEKNVYMMPEDCKFLRNVMNLYITGHGKLLYLMLECPHFTSFQMKNFKDKDIFWYTKPIIEALRNYFMSKESPAKAIEPLNTVLQDFLDNTYPQFMYQIHNKVNAKFKEKNFSLRPYKKILDNRYYYDVEEEYEESENDDNLAQEEANVQNN